jgi:RND family efflux transporter MFP subunit
MNAGQIPMSNRLLPLPSYLALLMMLSLTTAAITGCSKPLEVDSFQAGSSATIELPKVATAKPIRQSLLQKTEQPGRVEAFSTTRILAKVSGFIDKQFVDIGDRVAGPTRDDQGNITKPGQVLAVLVAPELMDERKQKEVMIVQATADIEQAQAAVEVAESVAKSAEANVDEFLAGAKKADSEYQRWKSEADRIELLASSQTVTQKLADETRQQMLAADASRAEAAAKIRSAKAKQNEAVVGIAKTKADLNSAEAKRQIAEAELQRVESMCEYLVIRAPYDGVITERNFDLGALIQASKSSEDKPLFTIVQTDKIRVFLDVPETDAALVEQGRKATIKVPSLGGRVFEGTVTRTSWALQAGSRTLRSEIDVMNEAGVLRPGMYANVELTVAERQDVLTLPKAAVVILDGQSYCMAVSADGTVIRKAIKTGIRSATDIEITSGLDGSEDVITANAAAFKDGQKVQKASK